MKYIWLLVLLCFITNNHAQSTIQDTPEKAIDSTNKSEFLDYIVNGYLPTKYFLFDLRYLLKYNQYETFRTGLGGITTNAFSNKIRVNGYAVYGLGDEEFKYSVGGGFRLSQKTNTWLSYKYTSDLEESGSNNFSTDKRFFQFIEPRLFNISLFHRNISHTISIEHQLAKTLLSDFEMSVNNIEPTYKYIFSPNAQDSYRSFELSLLKATLQWNPFSVFRPLNNVIVEEKEGFPKFTLQFTKSFKDVLGGDLNFSKLDFRIVQQFNYSGDASSQLVFTSGLADGDVPITHTYHAYPNSVNKETILQRFTIAGINSFETMYFNEFFSDKLITVRFKHNFKSFNISPRFKPQLALLSKFAVGNMRDPEQHEFINFNTLDQGYFESGLEINRILLGFGLSFAYRYGYYHLPNFEDNISFKFTFSPNIKKR